MTFNVLSDISLETPAGMVNLNQGQVIRLSKDEAKPLIEAGLITPEGRVAYKVYSNILQAFLWVVQDDAGVEELRAEGINESIYTDHEIAELKKMPKEALKAIHNVKEVFPESVIKDVKRQKQS